MYLRTVDMFVNSHRSLVAIRGYKLFVVERARALVIQLRYKMRPRCGLHIFLRLCIGRLTNTSSPPVFQRSSSRFLWL